VIVVSLPAAATPEIATWAANAPEWNERLGVTLMRQGCDSGPSACLKRMRDAAQAQQISRWAIAVVRSADQLPAEALEYSRLSLSEPRLVEVDIDDFLSALKSWHGNKLGRGNEVLAGIARNLKHHNPRLRFGVTLYEDELDSRFLNWIPTETRDRVDRVILYLHYRANANEYTRYVATAKRLFPRAKVFAGSYAYDRIDYLPCAESNDRQCGKDEELDFFRESLDIQLGLLRSGELAGIEFYPGFFGREDKWNGWAVERICRPLRRPECIENTRRMRRIVADELTNFRSTATSRPSNR
jgi:hypothetical protein